MKIAKKDILTAAHQSLRHLSFGRVAVLCTLILFNASSTNSYAGRSSLFSGTLRPALLPCIPADRPYEVSATDDAIEINSAGRRKIIPKRHIFGIKDQVTPPQLSILHGPAYMRNNDSHLPVRHSTNDSHLAVRHSTIVFEDLESKDKLFHALNEHVFGQATGLATQKVLVIVNPVSGGGRGQKIWDTVRPLLESSSLTLDVRLTTKKEEALTIVQELVPGQGQENTLSEYSGVIAVGGDGTLHEVLNGMTINGRQPPSKPVMVIPAGNANGLAASLGIRNPLRAALGIIRALTPHQSRQALTDEPETTQPPLIKLNLLKYVIYTKKVDKRTGAEYARRESGISFLGLQTALSTELSITKGQPAVFQPYRDRLKAMIGMDRSRDRNHLLALELGNPVADFPSSVAVATPKPAATPIPLGELEPVTSTGSQPPPPLKAPRKNTSSASLLEELSLAGLQLENTSPLNQPKFEESEPPQSIQEQTLQAMEDQPMPALSQLASISEDTALTEQELQKEPTQPDTPILTKQELQREPIQPDTSILTKQELQREPTQRDIPMIELISTDIAQLNPEQSQKERPLPPEPELQQQIPVPAYNDDEVFSGEPSSAKLADGYEDIDDLQLPPRVAQANEDEDITYDFDDRIDRGIRDFSFMVVMNTSHASENFLLAPGKVSSDPGMHIIHIPKFGSTRPGRIKAMWSAGDGSYISRPEVKRVKTSGRLTIKNESATGENVITIDGESKEGDKFTIENWQHNAELLYR